MLKIIKQKTIFVFFVIIATGLSCFQNSQAAIRCSSATPVPVKEIASNQQKTASTDDDMFMEFARIDKELAAWFKLNTAWFNHAFKEMNPAFLSTRFEEKPKRFVFFMDIPDIDPQRIDITIHNRMLTIKTQKELTNKKTKPSDTHDSQAYFYYRFTLPDSAALNTLSAEIKHGTLAIIIPKVEKLYEKLSL
jgi:HSP20 family molecular chaperone IbpA